MSTQRYTPEFKEEAVRQVVDRGYSVAEVSFRLGVSSHSLYQWVKAVTPDKTKKQVAELIEAKSEILKLRAQLHRTEKERDILKTRIMRRHKIRAIRGYKAPRPIAGRPSILAPNRLNRDCTVDTPDRVWVTDIAQQPPTAESSLKQAVERRSSSH